MYFRVLTRAPLKLVVSSQNVLALLREYRVECLLDVREVHLELVQVPKLAWIRV